MNDFNFFYPYIKKSKEEEKKVNRIVVTILAVMAVCSVVYIYKDKIMDISSEMVSKPESETEEAINELEQKRMDLLNLKSADKYIEESNFINQELLDSISSYIEMAGIDYDSINVDIYSSEIKGRAKTVLSTAEYGSMLKNIEKSDDVFVTNISYKEDGDYYNFILNMDFQSISKPVQPDDQENIREGEE